jgi:hypothetical protein
LNVIEFKAKATEIVLAGNQVPDHIKLPELEDILKMGPPPTPNTRGEETDHQDDNMTTFMFVVEHLVGAMLGGKSVGQVQVSPTCFDKIYTIRQGIPLCHLVELLQTIDECRGVPGWHRKASPMMAQTRNTVDGQWKE